MFFNDKIATDLLTVPKKRSGIPRRELIQSLLPKQFYYLNSIPDLRNSAIDLYDEFETLTQILKHHLNIY